MYWQERYVCDKLGLTPEQRKERALERSKEYQKHGYYTRIRKATEGKRIAYKVFVKVTD